jgi:mannose-1-phosphate guanylyltransferase
MRMRDAGLDPKVVEAIFPSLPRISIDYAVMEKTDRLVVLPASFDWMDIGSWTALSDLYDADSDGNVFKGNFAAMMDSHNCVGWTEDKLVGTLGVSDLVIVQSGDSILVCHKSRVQDLKKLRMKVAKNHSLRKFL